MICGIGAYEGDKLRLYGHGLIERQQRGPAGLDEPATCTIILARRYLCNVCGAVMIVVPASCAPGKHFSGAAIALALALWGGARRSAAAVREKVNDWKRVGPAARGWRSLQRWARAAAAGELFKDLALGTMTCGPRECARRAAQALSGLAPFEWRSAPIWHQSQIGASHVS